MLRCRQGQEAAAVSENTSAAATVVSDLRVLTERAHGYFFLSFRFENVCRLSFYMNNLAEYNLESHFPSLQILFCCFLTFSFGENLRTASFSYIAFSIWMPE